MRPLLLIVFSSSVLAGVAALTPVRGDPDGAAQGAPFGLRWGMPIEDLSSLGVTASDKRGGDYGIQVTASALPKGIPDQGSFILFFGYDNRLWRVVCISREFANDGAGFDVKSKFKDVIDLLKSKYGLPRKEVFADNLSGESFFNDPSRFVYGTMQHKIYTYFTWDRKDVDIEADISAIRTDSAYFKIIYEFKPLKEGFAAQARAKAKDAL